MKPARDPEGLAEKLDTLVGPAAENENTVLTDNARLVRRRADPGQLLVRKSIRDHVVEAVLSRGTDQRGGPVVRAGCSPPCRTTARPRPRIYVAWTGPALALFSVILLPWTVYIAASLPSRQVSPNYDTGCEATMTGRRGDGIGSERPRHAGAGVHGIDRMVRNIETGRFERSLAALSAAGARILRDRLAEFLRNVSVPGWQCLADGPGRI